MSQYTALQPVEADMQAVDQLIRQALHSDVALVNQVAEYIIHSGGKRLRPALLLLCARACGYRGTDHHCLAAVVEFIHTATLLHDDVVDESTLRRGRQTANANFGNPASVLVGDFLYSRAFQMMVGVGQMKVMQVLADATNIIAEGEVLQLLNCNDPDTTVEAYLRVIQYKTAKLFEAACSLGGILAGVDEAGQQQLAAYGMHLGAAFQLTDDLLDYRADTAQTGKCLGDDLSEGKPTLPLIYAMAKASAEQLLVLRTAITEGGRTHFDQVIAILHACDSLNATRAHAQQEADLAKASLNGLANSAFKQSLLELADLAVNRNS